MNSHCLSLLYSLQVEVEPLSGPVHQHWAKNTSKVVSLRALHAMPNFGSRRTKLARLQGLYFGLRNLQINRNVPLTMMSYGGVGKR